MICEQSEIDKIHIVVAVEVAWESLRLKNFFEYIIRDSPFDFIIGIPARNTINNIRIRASISRCPFTNMADTPPMKAPKQANSPKIHHFGHSSTHPDW